MDIKIIDNFIKSYDLDEINFQLSQANWKLHSSLPGDSDSFLMWDVSHIKYFNKTLYNKIQREIGVDTELERIYFNGQHSGREGELHIDGCDITALIYISEYHPNWGGFTQIIHSIEEQFIVPPVQNRLLLFDGNMYHKGYSYSYQKCPMRISLAYKLKIK
mgnify:FL=1